MLLLLLQMDGCLFPVALMKGRYLFFASTCHFPDSHSDWMTQTLKNGFNLLFPWWLRTLNSFTLPFFSLCFFFKELYVQQALDSSTANLGHARLTYSCWTGWQSPSCAAELCWWSSFPYRCALGDEWTCPRSPSL